MGHTLSFIGSINEYLMTLGKGWDVSFLCISLSKVLKNLQIGTNTLRNQKYIKSFPCMALYVIFPFDEPSVVLQTIVESCSSLGAIVSSLNRERKFLNYIQVGKAVDYATTLDETLNLSVPTLFGFNVPKLVLQVLTVKMILNASKPSVAKLDIHKEIDFIV